MLIRNADINFGTRADIRIADDVVVGVGDLAPAEPSETVIDAAGRAVLPGLRDHHLHLFAFAAAFDSVQCGPPAVTSECELTAALRARQAVADGGWIRGIGYHQSVAGDIDRDWLDRVIPANPVRIQHRSGQLWVLNSSALDRVASGRVDTKLERVGGRLTGRLYDGDSWLRERIGTNIAPIGRAATFLLSRGVTGFTDAGPGNGPAEFALFQQAQAAGDIVQDVVMMGSAALGGLTGGLRLTVGATKIHLREAALPALDDVAATILQSHRHGRPVAFHCTTRTELIFALASLAEAGPEPGDRIEHAGVAPPELLRPIADGRLTVVTQPNFVFERGDSYLRDVNPVDQPFLYRLRSWLDAGVPLAGGTDAPFGDADPWKAMQAAVTRRTRLGAALDLHEALSPEEAFGLFIGDLRHPGGERPTVRPGIAADLCILDRSWSEARRDLSQVDVRQTIKGGRVVWPRSGAGL